MSKEFSYNVDDGRRFDGLVERRGGFWGMAPGGVTRVRYFPNLPLNPTWRFFTTNPIITSVTMAAGRMWLTAYTRPDFGDPYHLVYWDNVNNSWLVGPEMASMTGDSTPLPALVRPNPDDSTHPYILTSKGVIIKHNMASPTVSTDSNADDWLFRTNTPDEVDDGGSPAGNFGYGWTGTLLMTGIRPITEAGIRPFNPFETRLYTSDPLRDAHDGLSYQPAGYGVVLWGKLINFFYFKGDWYGLLLGMIHGAVDAALTLTDAGASAALALVAIPTDEEPSDVAKWNGIMGLFAPYNLALSTRPALFATATTYSDIQTGDYAYFLGCVKSPASSTEFSSAVYYIAGRSDVHSSLSVPTPECYFGTFVMVNGVVYLPIMCADIAELRIYRLDTEPNSWSIAATYSWGGDPHIAICAASSGTIHVVLGKLITSVTETVTTGTPSQTGWPILNWSVRSETWIRTTNAYPAPNVSDTGILPRWWNLGGSVSPDPGGGGGGGVGPPGQYCDDLFTIHGPSTISRSVWADLMHEYNSPLLDYNDDPDYWYDIIVGYGVDPNFAAALWIKETQFGSVTGAVGPHAHNIGNIRPHDWGRQAFIVTLGPDNRFSGYNNWLDGVLDWCELWDLSIYAGLTLSEAIYRYAPPSENDTDYYLRQLCSRMIDFSTR